MLSNNDAAFVASDAVFSVGSICGRRSAETNETTATVWLFDDGRFMTFSFIAVNSAWRFGLLVCVAVGVERMLLFGRSKKTGLFFGRVGVVRLMADRWLMTGAVQQIRT
jgi:hypothetical protein